MIENCFVQEIRERWHPLPPAEHDGEPGYRAKGWTDEGAFAMCVFQQAMGPYMSIKPKRCGSLCEAEGKNQVLLRPLDALLCDIRSGPLFVPQPRNQISEALTALRGGLQRQATETMPSEPISVGVPGDLEELLHVTDGVAGAGLPSETANTYLIS